MPNLGAKGFNPKKGSMPVLQWMPPKMLAVDPAYQRSIDNTTSRTLIHRIAKHWNWELCQPLVVSQREDRQLYVVDGQHRLAAAIERGDIEQLPCFICSLPDIAAEAQRFVEFNRNRKALKPLDLWKAAVASGDAEALQLVAALDRAGLTVHNSSNNSKLPLMTVTNIPGLQRCLREQGVDQLKIALDVMAKAFGHEPLQYAGTIFTGIAAIIAYECKDCMVELWPNTAAYSLLIACLQSKTQLQWFSHVQRSLADRGGLRKQVTADVFREAWTKSYIATQTKPADVPPAPTAPSSIVTKPAAVAPVAVTPAKPKAGSLDPLAKAIIERHGIARPAASRSQ